MSESDVNDTETNGGLSRAILLLFMCSVLGVVLAFIWRSYGVGVLPEMNSKTVSNMQHPASDQKFDNLIHEVDILKKSIEQISVAQNVTGQRIAALEARQLPAAFFDPAFYFNPALYYLGALPARTNVAPQHSSLGTATTARPRRGSSR